jgi:hypothetical protein
MDILRVLVQRTLAVQSLQQRFRMLIASKVGIVILVLVIRLVEALPEESIVMRTLLLPPRAYSGLIAE